jgi:hypothetical protein
MSRQARIRRQRLSALVPKLGTPRLPFCHGCTEGWPVEARDEDAAWHPRWHRVPEAKVWGEGSPWSPCYRWKEFA